MKRLFSEACVCGDTRVSWATVETPRPWVVDVCGDVLVHVSEGLQQRLS